MIDLSDAVNRRIKIALVRLSGKPHKRPVELFPVLFLPIPRRGEQVEIGGSYLRYVSMPGQLPIDAGTIDGETNRKKWDRMRRKVAANARIK